MKPLFQKHLLSKPVREISGEGFVFEGTLVVGDGCASLRLGDGEELVISDPNIEKRLMQAVPPYVGGHHLYYDRVRMEGVLSFDDGRIVIRKVEKGVVIREDEGEYPF